MNTHPLSVILLSGGSGSRLWPLSNESLSKQFLTVLRDDTGHRESMVQRTVRLVRQQYPEVPLTIATSASQEALLGLQIASDYAVSVEPARRDTAPAILLAAAHVAWEQRAPRDSTVVVMPIDTFADPSYYANIARLDQAVRTTGAEIALLGVRPTHPSEQFGYIVPEGTEIGAGALRVRRFQEKPDAQTAQALIEQNALWNCGVFACRLGYLLDLVRSYSEATSYEELRTHYGRLPKTSFDYEVVERAERVVVLPHAGTWKDLGTWNTLSEELAEATSGKVWLDAASTANVHAINETGLPLVVAGLRDAVVVATADGILVSDKDTSSQIKDLTAAASAGRSMRGQDRWGSYRVLDEETYADGTQVRTQELTILPGRELPRQRHARHMTVWTVAAGDGWLVVDGKERPIGAGDAARIAPGRPFAAKARTELHVIEVQLGRTVAR